MADLESMRKRFVVAASVLEMYDKRDRVIQTQANNYGPPQKQEDR
jgi:hypothetical protein